jgi:hypothetical protein
MPRFQIAFKWVIFLLLSALFLAGCRPTQAWQDAADQGELRRLFNIPASAELVSYQGYPVMVGFGQREGLSLGAVYRLNANQIQDFTAQAAGRGWQALPIPPSLRAQIPWKGLPVPLEAANGYYLCQTAGDDVLHAVKLKSCADTPPIADIILGVLEVSGQLSVTVRSGY